MTDNKKPENPDDKVSLFFDIEGLNNSNLVSSADLYASDEEDEAEHEEQLEQTSEAQAQEQNEALPENASVQANQALDSANDSANQTPEASLANQAPEASSAPEAGLANQGLDPDASLAPEAISAPNPQAPLAPEEAAIDYSAEEAVYTQGNKDEFTPGMPVGGNDYSHEEGFVAPEQQQEEVVLPFDYEIYTRYYQPDPEKSKTPIVNFSRNEEEYLAKRRIVESKMPGLADSEFPLTRYEVELYYDHPQLIPDPSDPAFAKNSLGWVKKIHAQRADCFFMDTETTGMTREAGKRPSDNHRIITLGMVPMFNDSLNLNDLESMVDEVFNPEEVEIDFEAYKVHGFKNKDLVGAPLFSSFAERFVRLVMGKVLIIHNAPFDLDFVDMELKRAGYNFVVEDICLVIDSLVLARSLYQGRASLDALSERFEVNIARELHGALLDSMILAEVYTRMLNSLQEEWYDDKNKNFRSPIIWHFDDKDTPELDPELIKQAMQIEVQLTPEEIQRHEAFCQEFNIQYDFSLESQLKMLEQQEELAEQEEDSEEYEEETQELNEQEQAT
ncbi:hypothetical protein CJP74_00730 [Psittacicella melopsittaci]|uniref:DNA-directed DNA polymerase n=1 Tax=Psittacicella melopsittaci TaxID=2028576 RepID=A0A3A1YCK3_9GAMM|nr:exonuclease domain-containing protein [Psittacicella melopsittaci]RIY33857.1 hypothetical protein CJP74_00730 [Psittacicella melopsittaci]